MAVATAAAPNMERDGRSIDQNSERTAVWNWYLKSLINGKQSSFYYGGAVLATCRGVSWLLFPAEALVRIWMRNTQCSVEDKDK